MKMLLLLSVFICTLVANVAFSQSVNGIGGCPGAYPSCSSCGPNACGQTCCATEREPGFNFSYPSNCTSWVTPRWTNVLPGLICHLDVDVHLFDTDIEVYAVDLQRDTSCAGRPDRYQKSKKGEVSCSHFTSLFNGSRCARRVENKVAQIAATGYVPIFTDVDRDVCPTGRASCTSNSQCNNGRFCDGVETCVAGQCLPGEPPCTGAGAVCDESRDRCFVPGSSCSTDSECNNGRFCDGIERCVSGTCRSGPRPCLGSEFECSENADRCVLNCGRGTGRICP